MAKGQVKNHPSKNLLVLDTETHVPITHRLPPGRKSPNNFDADGFKAEDGTSIDGHTGWIKIVDLSTADVKNGPTGTLKRGCILCTDVTDGRWDGAKFVDGDWGEPL